MDHTPAKELISGKLKKNQNRMVRLFASTHFGSIDGLLSRFSVSWVYLRFIIVIQFMYIPLMRAIQFTEKSRESKHVSRLSN